MANARISKLVYSINREVSQTDFQEALIIE
jgi:hypothetical protein